MHNFGDTVTYIRHGKDEKGKTYFSEGKAKFKGMGLDGEGRAVVLLKDGDNSFNAFLGCLNRDKTFHERFKAEIARIEEIAAEGNKAIKALAADYNARTGAIYDELVGKPIEV